MRINDENILRDMRKNKEKSQRENCYEHRGLKYRQFYDASTDAYRPYKIYVYQNGTYVGGGCGTNIEESYNDAIASTLLFQLQYLKERNELIQRVGQAMSILSPQSDTDDNDDRL